MGVNQLVVNPSTVGKLFHLLTPHVNFMCAQSNPPALWFSTIYTVILKHDAGRNKVPCDVLYDAPCAFLILNSHPMNGC